MCACLPSKLPRLSDTLSRLTAPKLGALDLRRASKNSLSWMKTWPGLLSVTPLRVYVMPAARPWLSMSSLGLLARCHVLSHSPKRRNKCWEWKSRAAARGMPSGAWRRSALANSTKYRSFSAALGGAGAQACHIHV